MSNIGTINPDAGAFSMMQYAKEKIKPVEAEEDPLAKALEKSSELKNLAVMQQMVDGKMGSGGGGGEAGSGQSGSGSGGGRGQMVNISA